MSGCEDVKERLCEFLDGELPQADRVVVESHIQGCSACRGELTALRRASSAVHTLERRAAPAAILAGVRAGLKEAPPAPVPIEPGIVRPELSSWWRPAMSAAAVLIVAALIYLAYNPPPLEDRAAAPEASANRAPAITPKADALNAPKSERAEREDKAPDRLLKTAEEAAPAEGVLKPKGFADPTSGARAKGVSAKRRAPFSPALDKENDVAAAEPPPAAQMPVGTPPHIKEGAKNGPPNQPVLQRWQESLKDLASANSKAKAVERTAADETQRPIARPRAKGGEQQAEAPQVEIARKSTAKAPAAAPTSPEAPAEVAAQTAQQGDFARQEQRQQRSAQTGQNLDTQVLKRARQALTDDMNSRHQTESKAAGIGKVDGRSVAGGQTILVNAKKTDTPGRPAITRQVLNVPQKDVAQVLRDLERLAKASGGELAWQPASHDRTEKLMKKEAQQFRETTQASASDRVVIRVPEENMDQLLRAAMQYEARKVLEREAAQTRPQDQKDELAQSQYSKQLLEQKKANEAPGEQYVQLVVEFLPQSIAADASKQAAPLPAAKAKAEPTQQR